jgi:nucleoside diphosphate kinase
MPWRMETRAIFALIEKNGFTIVGLRKLQLTQEQAEAFTPFTRRGLHAGSSSL